MLTDQARTAKFEPAFTVWEQIRSDVLGRAVKDAVSGKLTAKAALDAAQKSAEALFKR